MKAFNYLQKLCNVNNFNFDFVVTLFDDLDRNFQIEFTDTLPLNAHKNGALAITIFRRIYLLHSVKKLNYLTQIALIRHEAEHILQQKNPIFYLKYIYHWLKNFLLDKNSVSFQERNYSAYRNIPYEVLAYKIEDETFLRLTNYSKEFLTEFAK